MRKLSRRDFAGSVGAGLLLAPFLSLLGRRAPGPRRRSGRRSGCCCSAPWAPTPGVDADRCRARTSTTFSPDDRRRCRRSRTASCWSRGCPAINVNENHGAPDGLTGLGHGYYEGQLKISVDQFIAKKLVAAGINRPISSLLLGAETNVSGSQTHVLRRQQERRQPAADDRLAASAFTTVFGGALPTGMTADALLKRRKSILDIIKAETTTLKGALGSRERPSWICHLDVDPPAGEQADARCPPAASAARSRRRPAPTARSVHERARRAARRTRSTRTSSSTRSRATSRASPASSSATTRS